MNYLSLKQESELDILVIGRAGVDLYAKERDLPLDEVCSFTKSIGGSGANIAVSAARLGAKVGLITRLADDQFGQYVKRFLNKEQINTQRVVMDKSGAKTSVAFTEMVDRECKVIIYRNQAADLQLEVTDIDEEQIKQCKILLVTGTALSSSPSREATLLAMQYAKAHNTRVILDLDYRPYSWENAQVASLYYQLASRFCDVVIGNREEYLVMLGQETHVLNESLLVEKFLGQPTECLIIKAGSLGSKTFLKNGTSFEQAIFPVTMSKSFGAGDSFAGALLMAMIDGLSLEEGVKRGSAAAAINVSRDTCAEAMPSKQELDDFIQNQQKI